MKNQYDIVTVQPAVSDGAHAVGDVMFNLTKVELPARAVKLVNAFFEVRDGGGEDETKFALYFFQNNSTESLGTLNATANISSANFTQNVFQGMMHLGIDDSTSDLDAIDNVCIYSAQAITTQNTHGRLGTVNPIILVGAQPTQAKVQDTGGLVKNEVYVAAVVHFGAPDLDSTSKVKLHLHFEY